MNLLIELLFPRRCPICDKPVKKLGDLICAECYQKICYVKTPCCLKCGKGLKDEGVEFCTDCEKNHHFFDRGLALYEYSFMKESIYRFKYDGRKEYAKFYGKEIAKKLGKDILAFRADAIVPVPLHRNRLKKRGYYQAALLAREVGSALKIPVEETLVERQKETLPQKEICGKERQNNLKNAFKIVQNDVKLKTIIIIDDIYTTGSTMDAMSKCLRNAGVEKIYCISLAI